MFVLPASTHIYACWWHKQHVCDTISCLQGPGDYGSQAAIGLLQALIPALLMNICIVGMNQIFDVDIDKVNKPYLPLASGDWSLNTGISVAVSTGVVAVLLGIYIGSAPLLATLVGSLLLGIAYSVDLPFLRWKKYPVLAMGCILSVRYFTTSGPKPSAVLVLACLQGQLSLPARACCKRLRAIYYNLSQTL